MAASPTISEALQRLAEAGVDVEKLRAAADRAEAADAIHRTLEARVASGRLPPQKVPEALRRLKLAAERQHQAKVLLKDLERQDAPRPPSAPTRELVRHKGGEPVIDEREADGTPLSAPRYRFEWAVDRMAAPMTAEEYQGLTRLREAYLRRQNTAQGVDWNGAGGNVPGPRLPISDAQLAAGRAWNAIWHRLDPTLRVIVMNFVLEEAPRGHDAPMTAVDFGKLYGATKDPNRARGVTVGALRTSAAVIARLWLEYDQWKAQQRRQGR